MDAILIKILATALTLSQVMTRQDAVRTEFNPARDRGEVVQLLRDGCKHMRRAFDIEDINVDALIETALSDPQGITADNKAFRGINFTHLHALYREFCTGQAIDKSAADLEQVIDYYNKAVGDLPDHKKLKGMKLPGRSVILDRNAAHFAETYEPGHRRIWLSLSDIPPLMQRAFIAAEDRRFFNHQGIDERAVVRAFIGNLGGQRQGGSTITQQLVKNLLVGDDITYDRKMREMIVASRVERALSKSEILELYLNAIYLGRGSWGIEMAAHSYFGKSASQLTLGETALLAGLTKGPNYYAPDKHPERAQQRLGYVLSRMKEDGVISGEQMAQALSSKPTILALSTARNESGLHLLEHVARETKALAGRDQQGSGSNVVRTTIHPEMQRATEAALQEGLAKYELNSGRAELKGGEANVSDAVQQIAIDQGQAQIEPPWLKALERVRLPLFDVHWTPAVVVENQPRTKGAVRLQVGLRDGRVLPLVVPRAASSANLRLYDIVYVRVTEGKAKTAARAELRVRPAVQGAAVVLENKTGRILAMTGGFSYALSPLDRATQSRR